MQNKNTILLRQGFGGHVHLRDSFDFSAARPARLVFAEVSGRQIMNAIARVNMRKANKKAEKGDKAPCKNLSDHIDWKLLGKSIDGFKAKSGEADKNAWRTRKLDLGAVINQLGDREDIQEELRKILDDRKFEKKIAQGETKKSLKDCEKNVTGQFLKSAPKNKFKPAKQEDMQMIPFEIVRKGGGKDAADKLGYAPIPGPVTKPVPAKTTSAPTPEPVATAAITEDKPITTIDNGDGCTDPENLKVAKENAAALIEKALREIGVYLLATNGKFKKYETVEDLKAALKSGAKIEGNVNEVPLGPPTQEFCEGIEATCGVSAVTVFNNFKNPKWYEIHRLLDHIRSIFTTEADENARLDPAIYDMNGQVKRKSEILNADDHFGRPKPANFLERGLKQHGGLHKTFGKLNEEDKVTINQLLKQLRAEDKKRPKIKIDYNNVWDEKKTGKDKELEVLAYLLHTKGKNKVKDFQAKFDREKHAYPLLALLETKGSRKSLLDDVCDEQLLSKLSRAEFAGLEKAGVATAPDVIDQQKLIKRTIKVRQINPKFAGKTLREVIKEATYSPQRLNINPPPVYLKGSVIYFRQKDGLNMHEVNIDYWRSVIKGESALGNMLRLAAALSGLAFSVRSHEKADYKRLLEEHGYDKFSDEDKNHFHNFLVGGTFRSEDCEGCQDGKVINVPLEHLEITLPGQRLLGWILGSGGNTCPPSGANSGGNITPPGTSTVTLKPA